MNGQWMQTARDSAGGFAAQASVVLGYAWEIFLLVLFFPERLFGIRPETAAGAGEIVRRFVRLWTGEFLTGFAWRFTWMDAFGSLRDWEYIPWVIMGAFVLLVIAATVYFAVEYMDFFEGLFFGILSGAAALLVLGLLTITLYWVWLNAGGVLTAVALPLTVTLHAVSVLIGLVVAARNYLIAVADYWDPYPDFRDRHRFIEPNARRRNYFFGPAQQQILHIFTSAWSSNFESVGGMVENRISARGGTARRVLLGIPVWLFLVIYIFSVAVFGSLLTLTFALAHLAVVLPVMAATWLVFSLTWLVDRVWLLAHQIRSVCPGCHRRYRSPIFHCACGLEQRRLVPSSYGVFHRQCACGARLPTTFFNGRSGLKATCPLCGSGEEMAATDARQFGITLVGPASAGKTVLIASFFHRLRSTAAMHPGVTFEVPGTERQRRSFAWLEEVFAGTVRPAATVLADAADMYSLLIRLPGWNTVQFTLYDAAGEAFADPDLKGIVHAGEMAENQGIAFVVDPLTSPALAEQASAGDRPAAENMATAVNNFRTFLHTMAGGEGLGRTVHRPAAVIITRADAPAVRAALGLDAMRREMADASPQEALEIQDRRCRDFLMSAGMEDFLSALQAGFDHVHFFVLSATGGVAPGQRFEPDSGLMAPFRWIVREKDKALADALHI